MIDLGVPTFEPLLPEVKGRAGNSRAHNCGEKRRGRLKILRDKVWKGRNRVLPLHSQNGKAGDFESRQGAQDKGR